MDSSTSYLNKEEFAEYDAIHLINLGDQNQYEGNYQEATKNYLRALESLWRTLEENIQELKNTNEIACLRASILSRLGDNLVYLGQHKIASEFYSQQLEIATSIGSNLDLAIATHKVGFCNYFMGHYESSIEFQQQSLSILSTEEEQLEFKQLRCQICLCTGLNQYALGNHELAEKSYEESLAIAQKYGLQNQEAEIIAYLSSIVRDQINLRNGKADTNSLEKLMGDLHYAIRIANRNPYVKVLASMELAKLHETIDIDIAQNYFENALNLSKMYSLPFSVELQNGLNVVSQKKQELIEQNYVLEEQSWYSQEFPKIPEVDWNNLETLGGSHA